MNASQQPLQGAAAMDGSAMPIHTEEGRPAKLPPPPEASGVFLMLTAPERRTALPALGPRAVIHLPSTSHSGVITRFPCAASKTLLHQSTP